MNLYLSINDIYINIFIYLSINDIFSGQRVMR